MKSHLEILLAEHIKERDLPEPVREFQFARAQLGRHWRADFAWPDLMLLVEVEGGIRIKGNRSHTGAEGYQKDCRKYNDAMLLGYHVLRFTAQMIYSMEAANVIQSFIIERMVKNAR